MQVPILYTLVVYIFSFAAKILYLCAVEGSRYFILLPTLVFTLDEPTLMKIAGSDLKIDQIRQQKRASKLEVN